ncbi:vitamin B12 dependent methionine synthase [bacterium]|nr:vitamin B12 dependent methionine synthase [bacterium]
MDEVVLANIPFRLDLGSLMKKLHVTEGHPDLEGLKRLASDAEAVAKPKGLYTVAFIESKGDDTVVIEGTTFTSRVLRVNLEEAHRVFVYLATCGTELDNWSSSMNDMLHRYWAETIKETALRSAIEALNRNVVARYRPGRISTMSPGALEDWPLEEQKALFAILANAKEAIGVELSDSLLMIPTKSVSGIWFPTEQDFESCQLCPRANCPGRRSQYDEKLYERKYKSRTD